LNQRDIRGCATIKIWPIRRGNKKAHEFELWAFLFSIT